jgi:hypothetical protein
LIETKGTPLETPFSKPYIEKVAAPHFDQQGKLLFASLALIFPTFLFFFFAASGALEHIRDLSKDSFERKLLYRRHFLRKNHTIYDNYCKGHRAAMPICLPIDKRSIEERIRLTEEMQRPSSCNANMLTDR